MKDWDEINRKSGKRNRWKCTNCGDVIESTFTHHMVSCICYKEAQRKRNEYSESEQGQYDKEHDLQKYWSTIESFNQGFFTDGGRDYVHCGGNINHMEYCGGQDDT